MPLLIAARLQNPLHVNVGFMLSRSRFAARRLLDRDGATLASKEAINDAMNYAHQVIGNALGKRGTRAK